MTVILLQKDMFSNTGCISKIEICEYDMTIKMRLFIKYCDEGEDHLSTVLMDSVFGAVLTQGGATD